MMGAALFAATTLQREQKTCRQRHPCSSAIYAVHTVSRQGSPVCNFTATELQKDEEELLHSYHNSQAIGAQCVIADVQVLTPVQEETTYTAAKPINCSTVKAAMTLKGTVSTKGTWPSLSNLHQHNTCQSACCCVLNAKSACKKSCMVTLMPICFHQSLSASKSKL